MFIVSFTIWHLTLAENGRSEGVRLNIILALFAVLCVFLFDARVKENEKALFSFEFLPMYRSVHALNLIKNYLCTLRHWNGVTIQSDGLLSVLLFLKVGLLARPSFTLISNCCIF